MSAALVAGDFGYDSASVDVLPHPWGLVRTFRARAAGRRDGVLKSWTGPLRIQRIRHETRHLMHLEAHGFSGYARPLYTTDGHSWTERTDGVAWNSYEYLDGRPPAKMSPASAALAADLLSRLHAIPQPADVPPSKLMALEAMLERTVLSTTSRTVASAADRVLRAREALSTLPHACIHGDFNLENILLADGSPTLIDFEFARWDVRLFDFAAMVAPFRTVGGRFQRAPTSYLSWLASAYDAHEATVPLTRRERALFGVVAMAHVLFIVCDLDASHSPFTGCATALLAELLKTAIVL